MGRTVASAVILFGVIWFAVSNASLVNLNIFFWNVSVSAALVIFLTFLVGFMFGVLRIAPSWFKKHSQVGKHQKELQACLKESKGQIERIKELEIELASERHQLGETKED
ncbi:hypothetical protein CL652_02300 [bacterium]|nr:hypothetical protein [bacterium]|tara:strand:+ start:920 stop:1249 length:330 start_codon:yes stop_codon:yes gene_type:complete